MRVAPASSKPAKTSKKTSKKKKSSSTPKLTNLIKPADMSIEAWQIELRRQQAEKETFSIIQENQEFAPGVFRVRNSQTKQTYKVVYRGKDSDWNFCSCLDFKTSQLGTCKHLEAVKTWVHGKRRKIAKDQPPYTSVYLDYRSGRCVKIRIGNEHKEEFEALSKEFFTEDNVLLESSYARFDSFLSKAKAIDDSFRCYDDALDFIIEKRECAFRKQMIEEKYSDANLDQILSTDLYPYQKEGIRFAIQAGKAIIADEMGLGKTIQAIASAEIYLREGMAESILIVCPTSLKYQWKKEIEKFTGGDTVQRDEQYIEDGRVNPKVIIIEGRIERRDTLYRAKAPYKIVSYHTVTNDIRYHGKLSTDVLIMDEIQRMKNWNTLIAKAARRIDSRYAVLLSGTPLENKLEELYSTMELADQFCLGPYYKFRQDHILLNASGKILGYKDLNAIGAQIKSRLIRRTKKKVHLQLPKRTDEFILVPMTNEQSALHSEFRWNLSIILRKYEKYHFLSEQDRRKMMLLLSSMRMVADSTFILDPYLEKHYDIKIAEVMNLLENIFESNADEKVVIFSEWERMTRLVAHELDKRGIRYENLNGSIPSKQRGILVENFTTKQGSRVFLSTDAGSTGLNLQVASTLINLDLPWNPAVLEQRIARIYRIGQEKNVQILNLVSKNSIEEGMIGKLRFKSSMFEGVLDDGADSVFVDENRFKKFMDDINTVLSETPETGNTDTAEDSGTNGDSLENSKGAIPSEQAAAGIAFDDPDEPLSANAGGSGTGSDDSTQEEKVLQEKHPQEPDPSPTSPTPTVQTHQEGQVSRASQSRQEEASKDRGSETGAGNSVSVERETAPQDPGKLINQGISFLSGLAQTLKSPEATRQLVDNLVEVDQETGKANIKIPVESKETVNSILQLFGKLLNT